MGKKYKCAIYEIRNIWNNKVYIGSSCSVYTRWSQHRNQLRNNKHTNSYLQNAWNKYKEQMFKFSIIEEINDKTQLIIREQYWLDKIKSFKRDIGYNINPVANSNLGRRWSMSTKDKIRRKIKEITTPEHLAMMTEKARLVNLGKKLSEDRIKKASNRRARNWLVISPEGKEYRIHNLSKFCRENNLSQTVMSAVGNKKRSSYKGWKCLKLSQQKDGLGRKLTKEQIEKMKGRKMPIEAIEKIRKYKLKTWLVFTPDNKKILVKDMTEFCKQNNLRPSCMHRVGRGERNQYKGYRCKLL